MFIGEPPGNHDRLLDFSTALTGNLFFMPTAGFLEDQDVSPAPAGGAEQAGEARGDGSLGIGGMKGEAP
jgi:putative iron-dependent peroxidase